VRERLPDRQECAGFDIEALGLRFHVTISRFADGRVAEIFITNHKAGSMAGILASDSAALCSIALQYGVPIETLRRALMRDTRGRPSGPLGVVLDSIAEEEG
jgi:hypothetical protein